MAIVCRCLSIYHRDTYLYLSLEAYSKPFPYVKVVGASPGAITATSHHHASSHLTKADLEALSHASHAIASATSDANKSKPTQPRPAQPIPSGIPRVSALGIRTMRPVSAHYYYTPSGFSESAFYFGKHKRVVALREGYDCAQPA